MRLRRCWNNIKNRQFFLLPLIILNIVLSSGHYLDNFINFASYAEPAWIDARSADAFWFILAAWLVPLIWAQKNRVVSGPIVAFSSLVFILLSCLTLLHYHYGSIMEFSAKINFLILAQVIGAWLLIPYTFKIGNRVKPSLWLIVLTLISLIPLILMLRNTLMYREYWVALELTLMILAIEVFFFRCFRIEIPRISQPSQL